MPSTRARATQLLEPQSTGRGAAAEISREGTTPVRRAPIGEETAQNGKVVVRYLAGGGQGGSQGGGQRGAETYTPMTIAHIELSGGKTTHTMALPEGWTCLVYVRKGAVSFGASGGEEAGGDAAAVGGAVPGIASMHELVYMARNGGDCLTLTSEAAVTDVLVLAGEPIGAPVVASGTMVMTSDREVQEALQDYQRGEFGVPWEHQLDDEAWAEMCEQRAAMRAAGRMERKPRDQGFDRIL